MSNSNLIRWSGLSALIGGGLLIIYDILDFALFSGVPDSQAMTSGVWFIVQVVGLIGLILLALGLVGLYVRQAEQSRSLGLIAFLTAFAGTMMLFGLQWGEPFLGPMIAKEAPALLSVEPTGVIAAGAIITIALVAIGYFLFGLASLQAHVLPRGAAVLLMIGAVLAFILFFADLPFGASVIGLAMVWMGYSQWSYSSGGERVLTTKAAT